MDDGGRLAQVPYEPGTEAVAVVGPRVYALVAGPLAGPLDKAFVRPRSLKAFDLKTGKPLWQRPVEGKLIAPPAPWRIRNDRARIPCRLLPESG